MQKKILIIEDEYDIASTLELVLEMENFEVRLCYNGKEALEILANESLPHLIFSDLMMPLMDGYQLCHAIRDNERYDGIPLILASAAGLDESKISNKLYQAFIRKPFDLTQILETVYRLVPKNQSGKRR